MACSFLTESAVETSQPPKRRARSFYAPVMKPKDSQRDPHVPCEVLQAVDGWRVRMGTPRPRAFTGRAAARVCQRDARNRNLDPHAWVVHPRSAHSCCGCVLVHNLMRVAALQATEAAKAVE